MLNWVSILRRILGLYRVRTLQELGMALGVPLQADSLTREEIPWPILERVTLEKRVSWDWLLTGREHAGPDGDAAKDAAPPPPAAGVTAPAARLETREFARVLLDGEKNRAEDGLDIRDRITPMENEAQLESALLSEKEDDESEANLLERLREIKDSMQQEIERVDRLLHKREEEAP